VPSFAALTISFPRTRILITAAIALLGLLFVFASVFSPGDRPIVKITGIDTVAYYGTAHSLLFDQDFDLSNQFEVLKPIPSRWNAPVPETGLPNAPFPIGFALLQLPFLMVGTLLEWLFAPAVTGYSNFSKTAWFVGVLFYTAWGLHLTLSWLRAVGQSIGLDQAHHDSACAKATLLLWPATTLGYYSLSPVPHAVSFFMVAAMLWCWWQAKDTTSGWRWARFGLASGLMFLCRWQDALILLIPIGWELRRWVTPGAVTFSADYWRSRIGSVAAAIAIMALQTLQWHEVYGHWITIPQGGDFLQWPPQHVPQVLFSSQHGWLSWTPAIGLGLLGLLIGLRRAPWLVVLLGVAMAAEISLIGAVSTWHGDRAFGMRYLTSLTPLVAVGLMLAFGASRAKVWQAGGIVLALLCAIFTLIFAAQYRMDLLPENEQLTRKEYLNDKIQLRQAMARQRGARQAQQKLDAGDPQSAWAISNTTAHAFGDNSALIDVATQAAQATASSTWLDEARQRREQHEHALLP
jgi:hypothetical protein